MDDQTFDQGREATSVQDLPAVDAGTQSLLNELSGMFEDFGPASPPTPADEPALPEAVTQAATHEEIPVNSPPRIEPPATIIWKPSRRLRLRFRR